MFFVLQNKVSFVSKSSRKQNKTYSLKKAVVRPAEVETFNEMAFNLRGPSHRFKFHFVHHTKKQTVAEELLFK